MKTKKFTILHSNDMHGDFMAEMQSGKKDLIGGLALLSGYINKVRKEEENVFFTFEVPEDLKARTYVVKFNYYFGCSVRKSDGEWDEYTSKSDPIPYTVTFTVQ